MSGASAASPRQVAQVRSFDRTVTAVIGALEDRFLGRDRPLAEARLLWEVGDGAEVRELRRRLGLDPAYASRLLRSLERAGLVEVVVDPSDARVRLVRLTEAGGRERDELDRRSDDFAAGLLATLGDEERDRLTGAMREVERSLVRARIRLEPVAARHPDVRWCFGRYYSELDRRFETGFDVALARRTDPADLTPPRGLVLIAYAGDEPVGCGALRFHADGIAADQAAVGGDPRPGRGSRAPAARGARIDERGRAPHGSCDWTRTGRSPRPSRCTGARDTSRSSASTTSGTRTTGSRRRSRRSSGPV